MGSRSLVGLVAILAIAAAACGTRASTTSTTAADVNLPTAPEVAPASEPAPAPKAEAPKPAGKSACKISSSELGTVELFVEDHAGTLLQVAPSGNVTTQRVRTERYKQMLIADEPNETDLVNHAAVVTEQDGKRLMRVGDNTRPWLPCE